MLSCFNYHSTANAACQDAACCETRYCCLSGYCRRDLLRTVPVLLHCLTMKFNNCSSLTRILPCLILIMTDKVAGLLHGCRLKSLSAYIRNQGEDTAVSCVSSTVSDEKTRKFLDWADAEGISVKHVLNRPNVFNLRNHFNDIYFTSMEITLEKVSRAICFICQSSTVQQIVDKLIEHFCIIMIDLCSSLLFSKGIKAAKCQIAKFPGGLRGMFLPVFMMPIFR